MRKRPIFLMLLAVIALLAMSACGGGKNSQSDSSNKVAGTLHFYTSQPDEDASDLVKGFNKIYPDVSVKIFRSGSEQVVSKLLTEQKAGQTQADVLLLSDNVTFEKLKSQGLLAPYKSKELKSIPSRFVDKDNDYTGTKVISTVIAYNTKKVKEKPSSWNDLTKSDAKNQIIMPSPLYSGAAAYNVGVMSRDPQFGWDFYKKLHDNKVTLAQGNGDVIKQVAGGQKEYGIVVDFMAEQQKQQGAPVDFVYPEEGVPAINEPIALVKQAKNKTAAKAFIDYVLSEKGQKVAQSLGYTPVREGMGATEGLKPLDQLKVLTAPSQDLLKTQDEDKTKFKNLIGG